MQISANQLVPVLMPQRQAQPISIYKTQAILQSSLSGVRVEGHKRKSFSRCLSWKSGLFWPPEGFNSDNVCLLALIISSSTRLWKFKPNRTTLIPKFENHCLLSEGISLLVDSAFGYGHKRSFPFAVLEEYLFYISGNALLQKLFSFKSIKQNGASSFLFFVFLSVHIAPIPNF